MSGLSMTLGYESSKAICEHTLCASPITDCGSDTQKYTESTGCNQLSWTRLVCISPLGFAAIGVVERTESAPLLGLRGEPPSVEHTCTPAPAPDACHLHNGCLTAIVKLSGKCCFNFHVNCNGQIVNIFWTQSGTIKWDLGLKHVEMAWWIITLTKEVMFEIFICLNI